MDDKDGTTTTTTTTTTPLSRCRFHTVIVALLLVVFVFVLDQLILATAVPVLADAFDALDRFAWLLNASSVTMLAFSLAYAQLLVVLPAKHVAVAGLLLFSVAQLIAGSASSLSVLLVARALVGVGAAGLYNVAIVIITQLCASTQQRAHYFALLGLPVAAGFLIGPLLGATLTQTYSWRWAMYANVPLAVVAAAALLVFLPTQPPPCSLDVPAWKRVLRCDWIGVALCLAWAAATVITFDGDGGRLSLSSSTRILALLTAALAPFIFVAWEYYLEQAAMLQVRLLASTALLSVAIIALCCFASYASMIYFFAEAFRALYRLSPLQSGLILVPYVGANVFAIFASSYCIRKAQLAWPQLIAGPFCLLVASTALAQLSFASTLAFPLAVSALHGVGMGLVSQTVIVVAQYECKQSHASMTAGAGMVLFMSNVGRLLGAAVASCLFAAQAKRNLRRCVPDLRDDVRTAVLHRAEAIWTVVPEVGHGFK